MFVCAGLLASCSPTWAQGPVGYFKIFDGISISNDKPIKIIYDEPTRLAPDAKQVKSYGVASIEVPSDETIAFVVITAKSTSVAFTIKALNSKVSDLQHRIKISQSNFRITEITSLSVAPKIFYWNQPGSRRYMSQFRGRQVLTVRFKKGMNIDRIVSGIGVPFGKLRYGLSNKKFQQLVKKLRPVALRNAHKNAADSYFWRGALLGNVLSSKYRLGGKNTQYKPDMLISVDVTANAIFRVNR